jgi:hypothetical protein
MWGKNNVPLMALLIAIAFWVAAVLYLLIGIGAVTFLVIWMGLIFTLGRRGLIGRRGKILIEKGYVSDKTK